MDEDGRKWLEFIQNAVTRTAQNSFLVKGWVVTIVAALFALSDKASIAKLVSVVVIPVVMSWALDGYFLARERAYRCLYDDAVASKAPLYSMDASAHATKPWRWLRATFSKTLLMFYGGLFFTIALTLCLLKWSAGG